MPAERLSMRKIVEVLRLRYELHQSTRVVAQSAQMGETTVREYLRRAKAAGVTWPLPEDLDEAALERRLFGPPTGAVVVRPLPDLARIHVELRRKDVTLGLLWTEYKEQHPDGYQYSQFCDLYSRWASKLHVTMRQHHRAGHKMFVDFSGGTIDVIDPHTGEVKAAKLFVAALGASSMTYARAVLDETLPTWLQCHVAAFEFFGGVTEVVVPDNLRSGVTRAHIYDPEVNAGYADLATHYATCVLPARARKPKDKAKAEVAVQVAQRWILAALRHRTFYSVAELNVAITPLLERINTRVMRAVKRSRREIFESVERAALQPLPQRRYECAEWKKAKVHPDYHVEYDDNFYSVPFKHVGAEVFVRATASVVEILLNGRRVASHERSRGRRAPVTRDEHMPLGHLQQANQTVPKILARAESIGPHTLLVVKTRMAERRHPEQAVRACYGILGLGKAYSRERLERACERAMRFKALSYQSIQSILRNRLDEKVLADAQESQLPLHENIRGGDYYH